MESLEQQFNDRLDYFRVIYSEYFDKFKFTNILARYSEIGLKSDKVRMRMEKRLIDDGIKALLKKRGIQFTKYTLEPGRMFFSFRKEDVKLGSFIILNTPGIKSISPVLKTDINLEHIIDKTVQYADLYGFKPDMSIGVKIKLLKRSMFPDDDPKSISEKCSNRILSKYPSSKGERINIASPDLKVFLEIRDQFSFIYSKKIYAFHQGLPVENERISIANMLGRFHDFDSWIRIMRRGQHVFPVFFMTDTNSKIKELDVTVKLFRNFYPIDHFYALRIDLEWVLNSIQSQLRNEDKDLICPLCRYFRFILLATVNHSQNSILAPSLRIFQADTGTSNLFKFQPPNKKEKEKKHSRKLVRKKLRDIRGIIDGESLGGDIFCPFNEDLWKTTAWIPEPIFQPNTILDTIDIAENLSDLAVSGIILEELDQENKQDKANLPKGDLTKSYYSLEISKEKIRDIYGFYALLKENISFPVCSHKNTNFLSVPMDFERFERIQKRVGIDKLVKDALLKAEFIDFFK